MSQIPHIRTEDSKQAVNGPSLTSEGDSNTEAMCVAARTAFFFYVTHRSGGAVVTRTGCDATEDVHIGGDMNRPEETVNGNAKEHEKASCLRVDDPGWRL